MRTAKRLLALLFMVTIAFIFVLPAHAQLEITRQPLPLHVPAGTRRVSLSAETQFPSLVGMRWYRNGEPASYVRTGGRTGIWLAWGATGARISQSGTYHVVVYELSNPRNYVVSEFVEVEIYRPSLSQWLSMWWQNLLADYRDYFEFFLLPVFTLPLWPIILPGIFFASVRFIRYFF